VLKVDADEDGVGGDDAADALRYLVATKPRIIAQQKLRGLCCCGWVSHTGDITFREAVPRLGHPMPGSLQRVRRRHKSTGSLLLQLRNPLSQLTQLAVHLRRRAADKEKAHRQKRKEGRTPPTRVW
jgi:hypothetical protein